MSQLLIAVPSADFASTPRGFTRLPGRGPATPKLPFEDARVHTGDRAKLETDERYRQLVAHAVLRSRPIDATEAEPYRYLLCRRTTGGGEDRLHGKLTIGIGGHIDASDWEDAGSSAYRSAEIAVRREIHEEIHFDVLPKSGAPFRLKPCVGLILDDSSPVSRVHLGLISVADVRPGVEVSAADDSLEVVGWKTAAELATLAQNPQEEFEPWSLLIIPELGKE